MSTRDAYHSALRSSTVYAAEQIDQHRCADGSIAFRHDVTAGLTPDFDRCDLSLSYDLSKSTDDLLHYVARYHSCIGDFCCGYGQSARIFRSEGKQFVCSDFNASCIGFIRETME
jgi:hypothetical protein